MKRAFIAVLFSLLAAAVVMAPSFFETPSFTVNLDQSPASGGTVSGEGIYTSGSVVTLHASPSKGYRFLGWFEDGELVSSEPDYSFILNGDRSFVARFAIKPLEEIDEELYIKDGDYLLALVTKATSLGNYAPSDLVKIPRDLAPRDMYLRREALDQLLKMNEQARLDGVRLWVVSAYRSYELQEAIFTRNAAEKGEEEANRSSARPGQSEHQLGTTVDFGGTHADFKAEFADTPVGKWLAENAYKYGFVMSYPENSEHITGYIYEPWHYRYIGVEAALAWKESGLTLTEFLMKQPQWFK